MVKVSLSLLFFLSILLLPQSYAQNEEEKPIPDYRNRINIPDYDPSLMPLNYDNRTSTGVWTELNPKVPRVDYLCIDFVGVDTGWAVGANGAIIYTTNGGDEWNTAVSGVNTVLLNVNSYNGKTVIVTGYDGLILRSTDAGKTWTQIASGVTGDLWRVQMVNDSLGWISGTSSSLLKTTDGGLSWEIVSTGFPSHYWSLAFWDENYGYVACHAGQILKTTDSGKSWELIEVGVNVNLYSIVIIDSIKIIAGGLESPFLGRVVYSYDGGENFGYSIAGGLVNCITFVNDTLGYAVGEESVLYRTINAGQTWEWISGTITGTGRYWMTFGNDSVGYNAGEGLRILKTTNKGYTWQKKIINDNFTNVWAVSENKAFAVSENIFYESLYVTDDGGKNWESVFPYEPDDNGLNAIFFTDSLTGYVGTNRNVRIYKTTDAGKTWSRKKVTGVSVINRPIYDIFFVNNLTGYASTGGGTVIKTTDSGENWFAVTNIIGGVAIQFIDTLLGFSLTGYFNKTTDGGFNWISYDLFQLTHDLFFFDEYNGFFIGTSKLFYTQNSGLNWEEKIGVSEFGFGKFNWINKERAFIVGSKTFYTIDSGKTWLDVSEEVGNFVLNRMHSANEYSGFGVGNNGILLKYYDTTYLPTTIKGNDFDAVEKEFIILQNYPNPFNSTTTLKFKSYNSNSKIIIKIYNMLGKEIEELYNGFVANGEEYNIRFNAFGLPSGIYFYKIQQNNFLQYGKMLLVK